MQVHLVVEDHKWLSLLDMPLSLAEEKVADICSLSLSRAPLLQDISREVFQKLELSVALVGDKRIQELNGEFREKNQPTNVLSFPAYDDGEGVLEAILGEEGHEEERYYLGDVILGAQTVEREAKEQGKLFTEHFAHLLVHGCLHVLGYDHMNDAEAEIMEGLEIAILKELSIANPYEKAYN